MQLVLIYIPAQLEKQWKLTVYKGCNSDAQLTALWGYFFHKQTKTGKAKSIEHFRVPTGL